MLDIHVFFSYSHKDEEYRDELASHLKLFERRGEIKSWHDRSIMPGSKWKDEIDEHIYKADIILALVSSDFIASDYCYEIELRKALERHNCRRSVLIPIIVRSVSWSASPLGKLQALPTDAKPVTMWDDRDAAWTDVTDGILKAIKAVREQKERFLELIPSSIRKYARECALMITKDDSVVNQHIELFASEHPEIRDEIKDYRKKIEDYIEKLVQEIEELYDVVYSGTPNEMVKVAMSVRFVNLFSLYDSCLIKELVFREKLAEVDLEPSLFGIAEKSQKECLAELKEAQKMTSDSMSAASAVLNILKDMANTPIRHIRG